MDRTLSDLLVEIADQKTAIFRAEAAWRRQIEALSEKLMADRAKRILLLAGPSSSGKTTTANMLRDCLLAGGHAAEVVSLDHFYRAHEAADYPKNADGTPDFEAPEALDLPAVRACMAAVLRGEAYPLPRFDFRAGGRAPETTPLAIPQDGYLIIEGLHALNPKIAQDLPRGSALSVFISVSTNIIIKEENQERVLLSGRKMRFLRRLVRDGLYRNADAARTYALWQGVLAGEDKFLYPFRDRADVALNSFHSYEVGLLRPFAEKMLSTEGAPKTPYTAAVQSALAHFAPVQADLVPDTSLLREFIPGGVYENLY